MRIIPSLALYASVFGRPAWSQDSTARLTTHLRFETAVSRSPIAAGDTATLMFRLRNLGQKPITLRFGTTCKILPHVARTETGELVYPSGGLPVCGAMVTYLTIPAHDERLMPLQVRTRAGTDAAQRQVLAPGDYVAYATVKGPYTLKPDTLAFSVQQDTARPPVPTGPLTLPPDSSTTIRRPGGSPTNVYYRNILEVAFDDSTSGGTVRKVLSRYRATIIGGGVFPGLSGGAYVIQVPDPGRTFAALQHLLLRLRAERGVHSVRAMMFGVRYDQRSHQQPSTRILDSGTDASDEGALPERSG